MEPVRRPGARETVTPQAAVRLETQVDRCAACPYDARCPQRRGISYCHLEDTAKLQARHPVLRGFFFGAGVIFTGLGAAGIFLPLLPTTPFLLLASACFLRSSLTARQWLLTNPLFGDYVLRYYSRAGFPPAAKTVTLAFLWLTIGISVWLVKNPWIDVGLLGIAAGVTAHILLLRKRPRPFHARTSR